MKLFSHGSTRMNADQTRKWAAPSSRRMPGSRPACLQRSNERTGFCPYQDGEHFSRIALSAFIRANPRPTPFFPANR
ncbi:hypothetical protein AB5T46_06040 [Luteimonas sp. C3_2_a3]